METQHMNLSTIPAHFDGERILLDEPVELEPDTKLLITVLSKDDTERESWLRLSHAALANAYDEAEDGYALDSIIEANPDYERG
jgi:hypothetical protein